MPMARDPRTSNDTIEPYIMPRKPAVHRRAVILGVGEVALAGVGMFALANPAQRAGASQEIPSPTSPTGAHDAIQAAPPANLADRQVLRYADYEPISMDPSIAVSP